jgi:hypothetical protein
MDQNVIRGQKELTLSPENGLSLPLKFAKCQSRLVTNNSKKDCQTRPEPPAQSRLHSVVKYDNIDRYSPNR